LPVFFRQGWEATNLDSNRPPDFLMRGIINGRVCGFHPFFRSASYRAEHNGSAPGLNSGDSSLIEA
jgi:hypothetical protein